MPYRVVDQTENPPPPFVEAFASQGDEALQTQAADLLLLGNQQLDDMAGYDARCACAGFSGHGESAPVEDVEVLKVPQVKPTGLRYQEEPLRRAVAEATGLGVDEIPPTASEAGEENEAAEADRAAPPPLDWPVYAKLAEELAAKPRPDQLAVLLEACLRHPADLVCVAAAIAYQPLAADPLRLLPILEHGLHHDEALVRDLAAAGLYRFAPGHPGLAEMVVEEVAASDVEGGETSMLIHGTWSAGSEWWQPGGSFHSYLKTAVPRFADLYDGSDRFQWSGGNSDRRRAQGAGELVDWVTSRHEQGLTLLGHSHGASIMMLASQQGLESELMMLLACPVLRHKYWPDFARVDRVISIRVRLDLVILAAGGGQRFRDPRIEENRLPAWFNHSLPRQENIWRRYDIPGMI